MAKTLEDIVQDIGAATAEMGNDDAAEFLDKLKDEIETMEDMIPESDGNGEEEETDASTTDPVETPPPANPEDSPPA